MSAGTADAGGSDDDPELVGVDHGPARFSSAVAVGAALLAVLVVASFAPVIAPVGAVGVAVLAVGLYVRGSRRLVSIGAAGLFVAALVAAALGALAATPTLVAVAAAMIAWDVGQNAVGVGHQLGRHVPTRRAELVHAAGSLVVATAITVLTYVVYLIANDGQPAAALVSLLVGAVLLIWAFRV